MRTTLLVFLTGLLLGCGNHAGAPQSRLPDEQSIRSAIQAHLAHKATLNLQAFDTEVKQVTVQGDHATADVEFRVKAGSGTMQLTYALEQHNGVWTVVESEPVGSNFSHPALDQGRDLTSRGTVGHSLADTLKSFKSEADAQPLPAGHPRVNGTQ